MNGFEQFVWRPLREVNAVDAPFQLVLRIPSAEGAENMYRKFKDKGIQVSSWPTLPPEVLAGAAQFAHAIKWRKTTLFISLQASPPKVRL